MALTTAERTNIIKLVVSMFNNAPSASILADLTTAYEANGRSLAQLARTLSDIAAYKAINPVSQTAEEFASKLLTPLGLNGNSSAVDFVKAKFNAGISKGQIAYDVTAAIDATTDTQFQNAKAILTNKTTVAEYFATNSASVGLTSAILSMVTADAASVVTGKTYIDSLFTAQLTLGTTPPVAFQDTSAADTFSAVTGQLSAVRLTVGATLTYSMEGGTVSGSTSTLTNDYVTVSLNTSTGAFTVTPLGSRIEALNANPTVMPSVRFTVTDNASTPKTASVTLPITVNGANDTPVITGTKSLSIPVTQTSSATGKLDITDRDAGDASFQAKSAVAGIYGNLSIDAAGNLTYAPTGLVVNKTDTFTVLSKDGTPTTVTVNITPAEGSSLVLRSDATTLQQICMAFKTLGDMAPGATFMKAADDIVQGTSALAPGVSGINGLAGYLLNLGYDPTNKSFGVCAQEVSLLMATNLHANEILSSAELQSLLNGFLATFNASYDASKGVMGSLASGITAVGNSVFGALPQGASAGLIALHNYVAASNQVSLTYSLDPSHSTTEFSTLKLKDEPASFAFDTTLTPLTYTDTVANDTFASTGLTELHTSGGTGTVTYGIQGVAAGGFLLEKSTPFGTLSLLPSSGKFEFKPSNTGINAAKIDQTVEFTLTATDSAQTPHIATTVLKINIKGVDDPTTFSGTNSVQITPGQSTSLAYNYMVIDRDTADAGWVAQTNTTVNAAGSTAHGVFSINQVGEWTYRSINLVEGQTDVFPVVTLAGVAQTVTVGMAVASAVYVPPM